MVGQKKPVSGVVVTVTRSITYLNFVYLFIPVSMVASLLQAVVVYDYLSGEVNHFISGSHHCW